MDKKQARALAKERRDVLPASVKAEMERKIAGRIEAASWYREAGAVLSYVSFRSEVSTAKIHRRILRDGKKLYLPKTFPDSREMIFFETGDLERLVSGYRGILEPEDTWSEWKGRAVLVMAEDIMTVSCRFTEDGFAVVSCLPLRLREYRKSSGNHGTRCRMRL